LMVAMAISGSFSRRRATYSGNDLRGDCSKIEF
jgi:hypothetical protein